MDSIVKEVQDLVDDRNKALALYKEYVEEQRRIKIENARKFLEKVCRDKGWIE